MPCLDLCIPMYVQYKVRFDHSNATPQPYG
uniref:Uncharacterized protein n=1 Tax=Arundo donax TaxID=35708 RepID=A0A0A8YCC1_ARUDO